MQINSAKDLDVYKQAFDLAMEIFQLSKRWPSDEKYSLTDQIRRSSRSDWEIGPVQVSINQFWKASFWASDSSAARLKKAF